MKHKFNLTGSELANSEFTRFEISIRLDDECHNRHDDFSLTGMYRVKGHNDKYDPWSGGGCCHEQILKLRPDLKIFADLHLCDSHGRPMYTIENGYYHMTTGSKEITIDYLRITSNEYDILKNSGDKLHFQLQLENLGILDRWQEEANKAIKLLEEMTGQVYTDSTTRPPFTPLTEGQRLDLYNKLGEGYYTTEAVKQREEAHKAEKKAGIIEDLKKTAEKNIKKINDELQVKLYLLSLGMSLKNFIYYDHSNTGKFNWLDYEKKLTDEEFNSFLQSVDYSQLPEGIKFELSKK